MAAPEIPNLLSLLPSRGGSDRSARGAFRSRGSSSSRNSTLPHGPTPTGAASPPSFAHPASSRTAAPTSTNAVIAATDTDAAGSRLSAVRAGWLDDAFAEAFYAAPDAQSVRRMPIINRGTYVRTTSIDALVSDFLDEYTDLKGTGKTCQIISLGAGTDTRWARFAREPLIQAKVRACRWIEVDFAETMEGKRKMLERAGFADTVTQGLDWIGVAMDLRELVGTGYSGPDSEADSGHAARESRLTRAVDGSLPTLLLSEMCLTYLPPSSASTPALAAIASSLIPHPTPLHAVLYEPLAPSDAFGKTMIQNLAGRGIKLPGLEGLPTLDSHGQRLKEVGFDDWQAMTVARWWREKVSAAEKDRLRAVEMVDEEEEWDLLAGHYGIIWAWRGRSQS